MAADEMSNVRIWVSPDNETADFDLVVNVVEGGDLDAEDMTPFKETKLYTAGSLVISNKYHLEDPADGEVLELEPGDRMEMIWGR